jgi:selenocysteine lyase/cysteine desulfurase
MSFIAAGIDLKSGDEVLITDQEHPSGRGCWFMKQARYGTTVREVSLPLPPKNPGQLADVIVSAIGPRTRVLSFSGITTTTGLILPVREICAAARARGVITVVDGAHMPGQVPLKLSDFGCDYFAGSPHKWLFTPAGCGLLYGREEALARLWPSVVTGNWDQKQLGAARFMMVGTNNLAVFEGMMAGLKFHHALGSDAVYGRMNELARKVFRLAGERSWLELLTPNDERMFSALVTFRLRRGTFEPLWPAAKKRRMWVQQTPERLRVSTHVHTRPADVDALFDLMDEVFRKGEG